MISEADAGEHAEPRTVRRLVLWRHGRTEWNKLGRAQGHANVELDALGRAQAERAAPFLSTYRPAFVWSSDLARARQTAEALVALTGQQLVFDERLREYDVGAREGMTFAEFEDAFPEEYRAFFAAGDDGPRVPGQESTDEVSKRMVAVLRDAAESLDAGQTGVLVGHGAALRTGLLAFFDVPSHLTEMLAGMSNCAWAVVEQRLRRGWQIVDYNAQTLPEPLELTDEPHA